MKQPKQHFTLTSLCVVLLATLSVVGGCSTESIDPGAGTDDGHSHAPHHLRHSKQLRRGTHRPGG